METAQSSQRDLVEELQDQASIAQCEENECHFKIGFSAGLLVQQEAVDPRERGGGCVRIPRQHTGQRADRLAEISRVDRLHADAFQDKYY